MRALIVLGGGDALSKASSEVLIIGAAPDAAGLSGAVDVTEENGGARAIDVTGSVAADVVSGCIGRAIVMVASPRRRSAVVLLSIAAAAG